MKNVLQDWVSELPLMQQTVLLTAIRGPDGVRKDHVSKLVLRWLRRCILVSAFDKCVLTNPYDERGGSFTGPSMEYYTSEYDGLTRYCLWGKGLARGYLPPGVHGRKTWPEAMIDLFGAYIKATDELPHHFQAHVRNSVEILGYKHPNQYIRESWWRFYLMLCDDLHLNREMEDQMDYRLADDKQQWLKASSRSSEGRLFGPGAGYDPESDNPNVAASRRKS